MLQRGITLPKGGDRNNPEVSMGHKDWTNELIKLFPQRGNRHALQADRLTGIACRNSLTRWGEADTGNTLAQLELRDLGPEDSEALAEFYVTLPEDDRSHRFCGSFNEETVRRYALSINWHRALLSGVFHGDRLVAVSELIAVSDVDEPQMEFAVAVAPDWQGNRLASRLIRRALADARHLGASEMFFTCLFDNDPMISMAHATGGKISYLGGEYGVSYPLPGRSLGERLAMHVAATARHVWDTFSGPVRLMQHH